MTYKESWKEKKMVKKKSSEKVIFALIWIREKIQGKNIHFQQAFFLHLKTRNWYINTVEIVSLGISIQEKSKK